MAKGRRRQPRKAKKLRDAAAPRPELNAASRAQLGRDEEKRPYRPAADDASVQDPLRDWPEES
ncbi:MAG TPA: hypothetical protein VFZ81_14670 [Burkholderiales bacterium]